MPISESTKQRLLEFIDSDKFNNLAPATQDRLKSFVGAPQSEIAQNRPQDKIASFMKFAPAAGQFVGGLTGSAAVPIHPYLGAAGGGTLGRMFGKQQEIETRRISEGKHIPLIPFLGYTPKEKKEFLGEAGGAAVSEAIAAPLGIGATKVLRGVGNQFLKSTLGRHVVTRAEEVGYKKLLNPEYYTEELPKKIIAKVSQFFPKAKKITGEAVSNTINSSKYRNTKIMLSGIREKIEKLMPSGVGFEDLDVNNKKLLQQMTEDIYWTDSKAVSLSELWKIRRGMDDIVANHSWNPESIKYIRNLRRIINDPIRASGKDIATKFDKYSFVMDVVDDLAAKTGTITDKTTGKIYSQPIEDFINTLSAGKDKTQTISMLMDIDNLLKNNDRIMNEVLDLSSARQIGKTTGGGFSLYGLLANILGGKKSVAKIASKFQSPYSDAGIKAFGRFIPTASTSLSQEE